MVSYDHSDKENQRKQRRPLLGADIWGHSSAGRAPALQAGGREFDPPWFHHYAVLAKLAFVRFSSLLLLLSQPKAYRLQTRFFGRTAITADASAEYRDIAQLVEHTIDNREVKSSILFVPTSPIRHRNGILTECR